MYICDKIVCKNLVLIKFLLYSNVNMQLLSYDLSVIGFLVIGSCHQTTVKEELRITELEQIWHLCTFITTYGISCITMVGGVARYLVRWWVLEVSNSLYNVVLESDQPYGMVVCCRVYDLS